MPLVPLLVETTAGDGSSFFDADYERAGARIVSVEDVWGQSELLLKVKEPIASEYPLMREGLVLFTYLHIAADEPLTRALIESGITAVAYETVETDDRKLPLLAPMSEIAGRLAAQAGAYFLEKPLGGRGLLLGGVPGVTRRVVVLGGGIGHKRRSSRSALGAGLAASSARHPRRCFRTREPVMPSTLQIEAEIVDADVVSGRFVRARGRQARDREIRGA